MRIAIQIERCRIRALRRSPDCRIRYHPPTPNMALLPWLLAPASLGYAAAIRIRSARYDRGVGVQRALVPVISVGNITTGGTGKTPLVMHIVRRLRSWGRRPAIVTRGY